MVREGIAAAPLSGFVKNIGNALDAGCFADGDPHVSWNAHYADEEGCRALIELFHILLWADGPPVCASAPATEEQG